MAPIRVSLRGLEITVTAHQLTPDAFASFGEVVRNPRSDVHPSKFADAGPLPFEAVSANQGTAIKYQHVTRMVNGYDRAPSGVPGIAVVNMFVCAARKLLSHRRAPSGMISSSSSTFFEVNILERHPYTTQTFTPLSISGHTGSRDQNGYLVIVAPNLETESGSHGQQRRPSVSSPPDLSGLRAFVATTDQAVTYGAGTWHAPMVALGPEGAAVDFVVTQFANGVGCEDCQEVLFGSSGDGSVYVEVPTSPNAIASKL